MKLRISMLAQSNRRHLPHTAPLCLLLPQWLLNALAKSCPEGQPQAFAQNSVEVQDAQPAQEHSCGYLHF